MLNIAKMLKISLAIFLVVRVTNSQQSGSYYSNTGITSPPSITRGPGTIEFQPTTAPAMQGDCTAATDSVYLKQVQLVGGPESEITQTLAANPNAKPDNSSGFFLGTLIKASQANQVLQDILNGKNISGAVCLTTNQQIKDLVDQMRAHANDFIPPPITGDQKYQDILQRLGAGLNTLLDTVRKCQNAQYPGTWLKVILQLNTNVQAINAAIEAGDTGERCLSASKNIAGTLFSLLSSLSATA